jgi:hypothetical protein
MAREGRATALLFVCSPPPPLGRLTRRVSRENRFDLTELAFDPIYIPLRRIDPGRIGCCFLAGR